ncbi:Tctex-1 [Aaosphaeria arxii CBS 175.79]|uniref:Tctex-1 n=1 Tax=Aaosphaeria arxii CBS 175.79 TaxID=1450172 RepID=A0A6A5XKK1_9PLEO|nr:Tctex-1 [Aaosphaeria arxii CBS 175.79]KAF2013808.1 Tctex-1 [Aaosphaeria arxii CBS 175.79]
MAAPLPTEELLQIANSAADSAFGSAEKYDHSQVAGWNTHIISLIEKTTPGEGKSPAYKYVVGSTVIQHLGSPEDTNSGRRGMHSAVGAFWNAEKDGTYSVKWEGGEKKGVDVVITITWIAL